MTPTEISAAYAALHERWPELRPESILELDADSMWSDHEYQVIDDDLAHAACFLACLKACAERRVEVAFDLDRKAFNYSYAGKRLIKFRTGISEPHTIVGMMDKVMQLPKENT